MLMKLKVSSVIEVPVGLPPPAGDGDREVDGREGEVADSALPPAYVQEVLLDVSIVVDRTARGGKGPIRFSNDAMTNLPGLNEGVVPGTYQLMAKPTDDGSTTTKRLPGGAENFCTSISPGA